jgi:hypothetical protein
MPEGIPPFVGCGECMAYMARRGHVIAPLIRVYARRQRINPMRRAHIFAAGLHQRHTEGKSL